MDALRLHIRKLDEKIGCPVILLAFLIILPTSLCYIDCRISCRRCHERTEHPKVLEVYCAMCAECKQRRREKMLGRTMRMKFTTRSAPLSRRIRMRDGLDYSAEKRKHLEQFSSPPLPTDLTHETSVPTELSPQVQVAPVHQHAPTEQEQIANNSSKADLRQGPYMIGWPGWPSGCPVPPECSSSEEAAEKLVLSSTTTRTTTTTTTKPPCPPIQPCRKKKKKKPQTMPMPYCMPCMPMCPCPSYTQTPEIQHLTESLPDYQYVYIGVPKDILRRSDTQ